MVLSKDLFEKYGYKVIDAIDGEEAVRNFMEHKEKIQLLMFDVIMPKKNGKEAYEEIKKIKPDIKVLFVSAYGHDIIHKQGILEEGIDFISKPASPFMLLKKVREPNFHSTASIFLYPYSLCAAQRLMPCP